MSAGGAPRAAASLSRRVRRRVLGAVHGARVRLRGGPGRQVLVQFRGLPLVVDPGVFHPRDFGSTELMAEAVSREMPRGASVWDLGTGSGALALVAATGGASRVVATDLDAAAVACAGANAARCGLEGRVEVRHGPLFEPVEGMRFDRIWWNPPYYAREPEAAGEAAFLGGAGHRAVLAFLARYAEFLEPGGRALLVLSDDSDLPEVVEGALPAGHRLERVASRRAWAETFTVVALVPPETRG